MIHFILPIYNEKENLFGLINGIRRAMVGRVYRIVAVDDGSSDGSLELLRELRKDDLVIIGSIMNMNVGAVFSAGIYKALEGAVDDDVIVIMESDQTSEQELVLSMVDRILSDKADVVVASRYILGGGYANFPLSRLVFSYCANRLLRVFFPIAGVHDYTIFFRAYRAGVLKKASEYFGPFGLIQFKGFVANAELLIKLAFFTKRITEVPFVYNYAKKKGTSKINIVCTINEYFALFNYMRRIFKKVGDFKKRSNTQGFLI